MRGILSFALVAVMLAPPASAEKLAVSQYGRITGSLPWVIAMKKGYFKDEGLQIDEIVAGAGGGTSLRNMLASEVGYAEVATSAALAAMRSGIDLKIVELTPYVANLVDKVVVCDDSRYGGKQAESGGDQGIRDPRGHSSQGRR